MFLVELICSLSVCQSVRPSEVCLRAKDFGDNPDYDSDPDPIRISQISMKRLSVCLWPRTNPLNSRNNPDYDRDPDQDFLMEVCSQILIPGVSTLIFVVLYFYDFIKLECSLYYI